jgi:hypothetical protein
MLRSIVLVLILLLSAARNGYGATPISQPDESLTERSAPATTPTVPGRQTTVLSSTGTQTTVPDGCLIFLSHIAGIASTLLVALFTGGLWWTSWKQWKAIEKQGQTAQQAMVVGQRAYLYMANVVLKRPTEDRIEITFPIYNAGMTLAEYVGIRETFAVAKTVRLIEPLQPRDETVRKRPMVVPPTKDQIATGYVEFWGTPLSDEEIQMLNEDGTVFFHGFLVYKDIFNLPHYVGFGFRTSGRVDIGSIHTMGFITEPGFNWFN